MRAFLKIFLTTTVVFIAISAWAVELSHIPGAFADIGYGARPMGMAGAFVGLADDRNAVMWNPAGLLQLKGPGVSFMWAKQLGFIPYNYLSCSGELGQRRRWGGAMIYSGDDALSETTALISYVSSLYQLGDRFQNLALALNFKLRWASFGNNNDPDPEKVTGYAFGFGMDLGLMWRISERISFGMLFRDIVNDIGWDSSVSGNYNESVPFEYTLGASYRPTVGSVLVVDVRKALYEDVDDRLTVGVEQRVFKIIFLRTGWAQNIGSDYANQDLALGLGIEQSLKRLSFNFDLAYLMNDLKNTPRIGVSLNW